MSTPTSSLERSELLELWREHQPELGPEILEELRARGIAPVWGATNVQSLLTYSSVGVYYQYAHTISATNYLDIDFIAGGHGAQLQPFHWLNIAHSVVRSPRRESRRGQVVERTIFDEQAIRINVEAAAIPGAVVLTDGTLLLPAFAPVDWEDPWKQPVDVAPPSSQTFTLSADGSITPAGDLLKTAQKIPSGQVSPLGDLLKTALKAFAGTVSPSGALLKRADKILDGQTSPTGSLTKQVSKPVGGTVGPTGSLLKTVLKIFEGTSAPSGALANAKTKILAIAGAIAPVGALLKRVEKTLSGQTSPVGTLTKEVRDSSSGEITPAGSLAKTALKAVGGLVQPLGSLFVEKVSALAADLAYGIPILKWLLARPEMKWLLERASARWHQDEAGEKWSFGEPDVKWRQGPGEVD